VNSFAVETRSPEALSAGMIEVASNESLRQSLVSNAYTMATRYYSPDRIEGHSAMLFRRAVASSNIRANLSISSVYLIHKVRLQVDRGSVQLAQAIQQCQRQLFLVNSSEPNRMPNYMCNELNSSVLSLSAHSADSSCAPVCDASSTGKPSARTDSSVASVELQLDVNIVDVKLPAGFEDVWSHATAQKGGYEAGSIGAELFLEFRGRRSVLCLRYSFHNATLANSYLRSVYETCSPDLNSVATLVANCDSHGMCRYVVAVLLSS
jgi:hypothetical protein